MLAVGDLHHRFGERTALDGVSISAAPGEIVGLVGRNGAGKTTTMRSIMGIVVPDAGTVSWGGRPVGREERLRFGYMPEERGLYPQMRLADQVAYFGRLHGMDEPAAHGATTTWLGRLGLAERSADKLIVLSHGNQQRVQLAVALVHAPELLVLDEPFAGLDPEAIDSLTEVLRELAADGAAILFSSHQLELVERICRRVEILDSGRVLASGTLRELRHRFPAQVRVKVDAPPDWARAIPGTEVVGTDEEGVVLVVDPGADPQSILYAAQAAGPVEHFGFESSGLIDLYRRLIRT
ncbi:MAG: ABC transporter ATP-binding protein [Solirubrobacteraceae bacterium]